MEISKKPEKTNADKSIELAQVAIAAIPFVGGSVNELIHLLEVPYSRRREKWIESIYSGFIELQEEVEYLNQEYLQQNECFLSTIAQASQIAIRTHQEEKLSALRNAVLNSTLKNSPDEDTQSIYLNLINILTPSHLRLLKFIYAPEEWISRHKIHIDRNKAPIAIKIVFPDYRGGKKAFYRMVASDLKRYYLISSLSDKNPIFSGYSGEHHFGLLPIDWGRNFLNFIETPQAD